MNECEKGREGWYCTRDAGHDGPCALVDEEEESYVMGILFNEFAEDNSVPLDELDKYFAAARRIMEHFQIY